MSCIPDLALHSNLVFYILGSCTHFHLSTCILCWVCKMSCLNSVTFICICTLHQSSFDVLLIIHRSMYFVFLSGRTRLRFHNLGYQYVYLLFKLHLRLVTASVLLFVINKWMYIICLCITYKSSFLHWARRACMFHIDNTYLLWTYMHMYKTKTHNSIKKKRFRKRCCVVAAMCRDRWPPRVGFS